MDSVFCWCGKQDLLSPAGSDRARLSGSTGARFTTEPFKSCSILCKQITSGKPELFAWCGKQDLNLHEIAFTRT